MIRHWQAVEEPDLHLVGHRSLGSVVFFPAFQFAPSCCTEYTVWKRIPTAHCKIFCRGEAAVLYLFLETGTHVWKQQLQFLFPVASNSCCNVEDKGRWKIISYLQTPTVVLQHYTKRCNKPGISVLHQSKLLFVVMREDWQVYVQTFSTRTTHLVFWQMCNMLQAHGSQSQLERWQNSYFSNSTTCFGLYIHHQIISIYKKTYMVFFNNLIKTDIIKNGFDKEENYCCVSSKTYSLFCPYGSRIFKNIFKNKYFFCW